MAPEPIPYLEESSVELDALAQELCTTTLLPDVLDPSSVVIEGCPVCRHQTSYEYIFKVVSGVREVLKSSRPLRAITVCRCTHEHPGRPDDKKGCGRRYEIRIYKGVDS